MDSFVGNIIRRVLDGPSTERQLNETHRPQLLFQAWIRNQ
jgi:hypothetical protein